MEDDLQQLAYQCELEFRRFIEESINGASREKTRESGEETEGSILRDGWCW